MLEPVGHTGTIPLLQVARFLLYGIIVAPVAIWVATYTKAYMERVARVVERLTGPEPKYDGHRRCVGRDKEQRNVRALLSKAPKQVTVICGANEVGKTRFLSNLLSGREHTCAVDLLGTPVASASDFVRAFVEGLGGDWLDLRLTIVDMLPVAGSEVLVLKERYSIEDLKRLLSVATEALERCHGDRNTYSLTADGKALPYEWPVVVIDGFGEWDKEWLATREGQECSRILLQWCLYITKERRLAHVIATADEHFALAGAQADSAMRNHLYYICLGEIDADSARQYLREVLPEGRLDAGAEDVLLEYMGGWVHDLASSAHELQAHPDVSVDVVARRRLAQAYETLSSALDAGMAAEAQAHAAAPEGGDAVDLVEGVVGGDGAGGAGAAGGTMGSGGAGDSAGDPEEDSELDPLKDSYSLATQTMRLKRSSAVASGNEAVAWTATQLWRTVQLLAERRSVPFAELRAEVFDGDGDAIADLIANDVLGYRLGVGAASADESDASGAAAAGDPSAAAATSGSSGRGDASVGVHHTDDAESVQEASGEGAFWSITAATPLMQHAFKRAIADDSKLGQRMSKVMEEAEHDEALAMLKRRERTLRREYASTAAFKRGVMSTARVFDAIADVGASATSSREGAAGSSDNCASSDDGKVGGQGAAPAARGYATTAADDAQLKRRLAQHRRDALALLLDREAEHLKQFRTLSEDARRLRLQSGGGSADGPRALVVGGGVPVRARSTAAEGAESAAHEATVVPAATHVSRREDDIPSSGTGGRVALEHGDSGDDGTVSWWQSGEGAQSFPPAAVASRREG